MHETHFGVTKLWFCHVDPCVWRGGGSTLYTYVTSCKSVFKKREVDSLINMADLDGTL